MREVTLVGPHTDADGKLRVKGEKVQMTDEQAEWYTQAIIGQRASALGDPLTAAIASVGVQTSPADPSANADVRTETDSLDRADWSKEGIERTLKPADDDSKSAEPPRVPTPQQSANATSAAGTNRDISTRAAVAEHTRTTT